MSRYGNVKAGAYNKLNIESEGEDTSEKLNDVERVLTKMGISIRKTNLEFKDFDEVLDEIASKWDTMDNVSKKAIANAFAGVRQQNNLLNLLEHYDKYQELLEVSENSQGTAERKYKSYRESYTAAKNEFVAAIEEFTNSSQISKLLTDLTNIGTSLIEWVQKLYPYFPAILSLFGYVRAFQGKSLLQTGANMFMGLKGKGQGSQTSWSVLGDNSGKVKSKLPFAENLKTKWEKKEREAEEAYMGMSLGASKEEKTKKYNNLIKAKDKEQKYTDKINKKELKFKQDMVKYSEKELQKKKSVLTYAERELLNEKVILQGEEERKQLSELEKSLKDQGLLKDKESLTYANAISILESGVLEGKQLGAQLERMVYGDRQAGKQTEDQIKATRAKEKIDAVGGIQGSKGALKGQAFSKIMGGVSLLANTVMTSVSQFMTAGNTHTYKGETVESSKEAQKRGGAASAILSLVPIIGSTLGPMLAESVAADYDKARDAANYETQKANEYLNKLSGLDSTLEQIGSSEKGSADRHKLVKDLRAEIFDKDNKDLQESLQKHLGDKNLSTVLDSIDSNTDQSAEALRTLEIAQIKAQKDQIANKYSSSFYENQEDLGDIMSQIDGYNPNNVGSLWAGIGVGAAAGAGAGALGGTMIAPGIGTLIGLIVGAVSGAIVGGIAGDRIDQSDEAQARHDYRSTTDWQQMNAYEKLDEANRKLKESQDNNELGQAGYYQKVITLLQRQISLQNEMIKELNELTLQEALVGAAIGDKYLADMTIEQLKNVGIDEILTAFAKSIEEAGGLIGLSVLDENGKLTTSGYDYLFEQIRKQGDEEINAVLSGEAFTLEEALNLRNKYGADSIQVQKILRNFADSLNLTTDELDGVLDKYGKLTLAETYLSTQDLSTKVSEMAELMGSVTEGAGQISSWMEKIISQFPELTYYMGNTSELLDQTIIKIKQYSHEYVNAQYQSIMDNAELFSKMKDELYDTIGDTAADALRNNKSVTKLADVMAWAQSQYDVKSGELSDEAQRVIDTVEAMANKAGTKVVSNVLKSYYDMLIDFRTKQIDKQVENLNSQKEALKEITNQREYENKLVEARLKLEDANKQKKRVYRAGVGWTYQSDQQAIEAAQKELQNLETEKKVSDIDARISYLEGQKNELSSIYEKENYETLKNLYEQALVEGDVAQNIDSAVSTIKTAIDGIKVPLSELIDAQLETLKENKTSALSKAQEAWSTLNSSTPGSAAYNTALENFHSAMSAAENSGLTESDVANWGNYTLGTDVSSRIKGAPSAWEVYKGDINDQKNLVKYAFSLKSPTGYYTGYSNGDLYTGSKEGFWSWLRRPLGGMYSARIWDESGERHTLDGLYEISSADGGLLEYLNRISEETGNKQFVLAGIGPDSGYHSVYYKDGQLYNLVSSDGVNNLKWEKSVPGGAYFAKDVVGNALGTLGLSTDSFSLINELGTEAIITPQGTLTALPSKTGVVPADITKNLWELGEVAPSLVRAMDEKLYPDKIGKSIFDGIINDDSFNISNLVMNVSADSSFDVDKFVSLIKSRVALTKNSK